MINTLQCWDHCVCVWPKISYSIIDLFLSIQCSWKLSEGQCISQWKQWELSSEIPQTLVYMLHLNELHVHTYTQMSLQQDLWTTTFLYCSIGMWQDYGLKIPKLYKLGSDHAYAMRTQVSDVWASCLCLGSYREKLKKEMSLVTFLISTYVFTCITDLAYAHNGKPL